MLSKLLRMSRNDSSDLLTSKLFDEHTFCKTFLKDLGKCQSEVITESPFVTSRRLFELLPTLKKLKAQKVRIVIMTKDPKEHDKGYVCEDATDALARLQKMGAYVIYTDGHHRKLAIFDRKVLYKGSLNILSQNNSRETMRRIELVLSA